MTSFPHFPLAYEARVQVHRIAINPRVPLLTPATEDGVQQHHHQPQITSAATFWRGQNNYLPHVCLQCTRPIGWRWPKQVMTGPKWCVAIPYATHSFIGVISAPPTRAEIPGRKITLPRMRSITIFFTHFPHHIYGWAILCEGNHRMGSTKPVDPHRMASAGWGGLLGGFKTGSCDLRSVSWWHGEWQKCPSADGTFWKTCRHVARKWEPAAHTYVRI